MASSMAVPTSHAIPQVPTMAMGSCLVGSAVRGAITIVIGGGGVEEIAITSKDVIGSTVEIAGRARSVGEFVDNKLSKTESLIE